MRLRVSLLVVVGMSRLKALRSSFAFVALLFCRGPVSGPGNLGSTSWMCEAWSEYATGGPTSGELTTRA
jgi:hypothetical protein